MAVGSYDFSMARQIQSEVASLIRRGCVVMTYKTKPRDQGGRQLVSVGPYHTATGEKSFALITKRDQLEYGTAVSAAKEFVSFVGRARAGEAASAALAKCGRRISAEAHVQINSRDRMEKAREHIIHNRNPWAR